MIQWPQLLIAEPATTRGRLKIRANLQNELDRAEAVRAAAQDSFRAARETAQREEHAAECAAFESASREAFAVVCDQIVAPFRANPLPAAVALQVAREVDAELFRVRGVGIGLMIAHAFAERFISEHPETLPAAVHPDTFSCARSDGVGVAAEALNRALLSSSPSAVTAWQLMLRLQEAVESTLRGPGAWRVFDRCAPMGRNPVQKPASASRGGRGAPIGQKSGRSESARQSRPSESPLPEVPSAPRARSTDRG